MKYLFRFLMVGLFAAAFVFAQNESFGGIGISILAVSDGALVVEVIPGTPAEKSGLEANDRITAVDKISLAGKSTDQAKELLRGTSGKPVEIAVTRGKESLSFTLVRVGFSVKEMDQARVESWFGDQQKNFSKEELELVAAQGEGKDYALVGVLQNGRNVSSDVSVSAANLSSVFVQTEKDPDFKMSPKVTPAASSVLKTFNRKHIAFELFQDGAAAVKVFDMQGEMVADLAKESALKGFNSVSWNAEKLSGGRYIVKIEQNGAVSGFNVLLK
ncbi:MAG: PDZ domain-containing protein [Fibrobacter sp.]|jgi:membrane-associated protease RseP (regulator of RpoE activity)|nr:PDZ domain-containing protein [Fibrobacter sp.]